MSEDERVQWLAYDRLRQERLETLTNSLRGDDGLIHNADAYVALMMERF